jgi:predicted AlkP superfamily phosphohydrolase/phosphomutase
MPAKVLVVWLDAAEPVLLERMMAEGELPTLAGLRRRGTYGRLRSLDHSLSEIAYGLVLTGQPPDQTGTWTIGAFDPQTYSEGEQERTDYRGTPFFPQLDRTLRTCIFDTPCLPILPNINGIQVQGWGSHSPKMGPCSQPADLIGELTARHGAHPAAGYSDFACMDDPASMRDLHERIAAGIPMRASIACDLLGRESWDLFFTSFGEPHGAGHYFWPHPDCLPLLEACGGIDALPRIYRAVDEALGRMVASAGPDARVVVFSNEGMCDDNFDAANFVLLPEILFRHSFPGCEAFDFDPGRGPSPEAQAGIKNWVMEVWHQRRRPGRLETFLRDRLPVSWATRLYRWLDLNPPLFHPLTAKFWNFQATTWMAPYRPHMKAFALISASDGLIRLNVRGREKHGMIVAADFRRACDEIAALLNELRLPETGQPAVQSVVRLRDDALTWRPGLHDADLIVKWRPATRARLSSPRFGELGPVPWHRSSAHTPDGFLSASGPGIPIGTFATGSPMDIAPTVLALAGSKKGALLPGRCLIPALLRWAAA